MEEISLIAQKWKGLLLVFVLQWYDHADSMDFYHQFIAVEAKIKLVKPFFNAQKKLQEQVVQMFQME